MTKDETLKLALEALIGDRAFLESDAPIEIWSVNDKAITALKEALAQPEQEPVMRVKVEDGCWMNTVSQDLHRLANGEHDLYAAPPQRTWVGLTAGEILDTLISVDEKTVRLPSMLGQFACAIEAKLKEKNT